MLHQFVVFPDLLVKSASQLEVLLTNYTILLTPLKVIVATWRRQSPLKLTGCNIVSRVISVKLLSCSVSLGIEE